MTQGDCTSLDLPWWNVALSHRLNVDCQFGFCWYKIGMVHIYSWKSLLLLHCLPAMANNASNTDSLYNDTKGLNQPGWQKLAAFGEGINPVLKIRLGPPTADFWSVWSSQKERKFRQIQPATKVRILCFEWKRICFQTRDVLCSDNMNYEE